MTVTVGLPHIRDEVREVKASQTRMPEFPDDTKPEEKTLFGKESKGEGMIMAGLLGCGVGVAVFFALRRFSEAIRWGGGVAAAIVLPVAFTAFVVWKGDAASPGAREVTSEEIARWGAETGEDRQAAGPEWPFFPGKGKVAFYTLIHDKVEGKSFYVVYPNMNFAFTLEYAVEHSPHFDSLEEVEAFRDSTAPDFALFELESRLPESRRYIEIKTSGEREDLGTKGTEPSINLPDNLQDYLPDNLNRNVPSRRNPNQPRPDAQSP